MALLSKDCKPDNSKSHKSIKRSFSNTQVLCSNFLEYEFSPESNSPYIFGLCETKLLESIDYLPLMRKDSVSHMHGLAVCLKERLLFAQDLSLESSVDSYLFFRLVSLHSILLIFPLSITFFVLMHCFWLVKSSPSTYLLICLSLETLRFILRTGWSFLVEPID